MPLLSARQLQKLIELGVLENSDLSHINAASIDLVLGDTVLVEKKPLPWEKTEIDMLDKTCSHMVKHTMGPEGISVPPGACVLAHTVEIFNLPNNISGEYMLKSTQARNFFGHLKAGWADAGWNGSVLTLEFVNHLQHYHTRIRPGMKCGQIIFFEHEEVSPENSYATRGQYNGDKTVSTGKGLK